MSNVIPKEVVTITSKVFGVTEAAMCAPFTGGCISWPYVARICAVMLIRRHTGISQAGIGRLFLKSDVSRVPRKMLRAAEKMEMQVQRYAPLAELVEKCEREIDALHEARIAVPEREKVAA